MAAEIKNLVGPILEERCGLMTALDRSCTILRAKCLDKKQLESNNKKQKSDFLNDKNQSRSKSFNYFLRSIILVIRARAHAYILHIHTKNIYVERYSFIYKIPFIQEDSY